MTDEQAVAIMAAVLVAGRGCDLNEAIADAAGIMAELKNAAMEFARSDSAQPN